MRKGEGVTDKKLQKRTAEEGRKRNLRDEKYSNYKKSPIREVRRKGAGRGEKTGQEKNL